jgi:hypothetical protein
VLAEVMTRSGMSQKHEIGLVEWAEVIAK